MSLYRLRNFSEIVAAVREELGVGSSDTSMINRIKRDVNTVYDQVVAEKNWWWTAGNVTLQVPAYYATGTASVTAGSATVTISSIVAAGKTGHFFALDGYNEIYRIESHTAGSATIKLDAEWTGTTNSAASYRIWTDRIPLPVDCKETSEVWHDHYSKPMEGIGSQEFRRVQSTSPRAENKPNYYCTSDFVDPAPTSAITSLPAVSTRSSAGVRKTIVFASAIPTATVTKVTAGEPVVWRFSAAGNHAYNGDFTIGAVSTTTTANDTITFTGKVELQESAVADTTLSITKVDQEASLDRYRALMVHPALSTSRITLHVDYVKDAQPLENDSDEPIIPNDDRVVLVYGALELGWSKLRNPEESAKNAGKFATKLAKMAGKLTDTRDNPRLAPSSRYLAAKRNANRGGSFFSAPIAAGGGLSGAVVSGTPSTVAVFDTVGNIGSSSTISTTELDYLNGVSSNVQTQIDALNTLADGKIYVGNGSNVATEVTMSGDVSISNAGVAAIGTGVVVNADLSASAAVAFSKMEALTASRVMETTAGGVASASAITATELTALSNSEPLTSVSLTDNTTTTVASWAYVSFDTLFVRYSLERGSGNEEAGTIAIKTDGTNVAIATGGIASFGTLGTTFIADISGSSVRLRATLTSTGTGCTMKYKLEKWAS